MEKHLYKLGSGPYFSIIIPTFNRAKIIGRAITSVLNQSFKDFEIIIADDGSTDDSREVIGEFQEDKRVNYYYQRNNGVCAARNFGAAKSEGKYLIFLDSDDKVEPAWLNDFYMVLKSGDFNIAFCNMKMLLPSNKYKLTNSRDPYNDQRTNGKLMAGLFAVSRQLFFDAGMYDEKMKFGENTELSYRLKQGVLKQVFINNYNIIYYPSVSGGNKNVFNKLYSNLYILEKHNGYFSNNLRSKKYFMKVAAVASARLGKYKFARKMFYDSLLIDKYDFKLLLQYLLSLNKHLARLRWKPVKK